MQIFCICYVTSNIKEPHPRDYEFNFKLCRSFGLSRKCRNSVKKRAFFKSIFIPLLTKIKKNI